MKTGDWINLNEAFLYHHGCHIELSTNTNVTSMFTPNKQTAWPRSAWGPLSFKIVLAQWSCYISAPSQTDEITWSWKILLPYLLTKYIFNQVASCWRWFSLAWCRFCNLNAAWGKILMSLLPYCCGLPPRVSDWVGALQSRCTQCRQGGCDLWQNNAPAESVVS